MPFPASTINVLTPNGQCTVHEALTETGYRPKLFHGFCVLDSQHDKSESSFKKKKPAKHIKLAIKFALL